ncbi:MAG: TlyA family RNA methyltransferase [Dehalococcoidia bacterium]|nr:TlyA family RNA methyltransferase [Dehalococcoidia bacterium]
MSPTRTRLDQLLVDRGLAPSREKARAIIMAGAVSRGTERLIKPGVMVAGDTDLRMAQAPRFVGRGGEKLEKALSVFRLDPRGMVALDAGASTGGFTDCLLQHGAARVYAVDVGHGQLDYRLRNDARVVCLEGINARYSLGLPELCDIAVADVSFISLQLVVPSLIAAVRPGSPIVALVKPQFEAGKGKVGKGGVVRDPEVHCTVLSGIVNWGIRQGLRLAGLTPSPIVGDKGNREFLILWRTPHE